MSPIDEVLDLLESHLSTMSKMTEDGLDLEDPRREQWQIGAGIILMGIPFWADVMSDTQRRRVADLLDSHEGI